MAAKKQNPKTGNIVKKTKTLFCVCKYCHFLYCCRHFWMAALFGWRQFFSLHLHLVDSCCWLAATFCWQPFLSGSNCWLAQHLAGSCFWLAVAFSGSQLWQLIYNNSHHGLVFSKHRSSGPRLSIGQNVRPCVCLSVFCLPVHFWGTVWTSFCPTSQSWVSKTLRELVSFGKSNGKKWFHIWKLLLIKGVKTAVQKKVLFSENLGLNNH